MKLSRHILPSVFILLTGCLSTGQAAPPVSIEQAWIPEAPPVVSVLAGYMTLKNADTRTATIMAASSPAFGRVEIHRTVIKDGMASMQQQSSLDIPAGQSVQLKPGGLHLMLIEPKKPLKQDDVVDVQFQMKDGSQLSARFTVKRNSGAGNEHQHHH